LSVRSGRRPSWIQSTELHEPLGAGPTTAADGDGTGLGVATKEGAAEGGALGAADCKGEAEGSDETVGVEHAARSTVSSGSRIRVLRMVVVSKLWWRLDPRASNGWMTHGPSSSLPVSRRSLLDVGRLTADAHRPRVGSVRPGPRRRFGTPRRAPRRRRVPTPQWNAPVRRSSPRRGTPGARCGRPPRTRHGSRSSAAP